MFHAWKTRAGVNRSYSRIESPLISTRARSAGGRNIFPPSLSLSTLQPPRTGLIFFPGNEHERPRYFSNRDHTLPRDRNAGNGGARGWIVINRSFVRIAGKRIIDFYRKMIAK